MPHGASIYNGHLRGPVTLTPNAERLAVELSLPVLTTRVCRGWDSNTQPSAFGANALTNCATAAARKIHTCTVHSDLNEVRLLSFHFFFQCYAIVSDKQAVGSDN